MLTDEVWYEEEDVLVGLFLLFQQLIMRRARRLAVQSPIGMTIRLAVRLLKFMLFDNVLHHLVGFATQIKFFGGICGVRGRARSRATV